MKTEIKSRWSQYSLCKSQAKAPTLLFLSPLPQSIHCFEQSWELLKGEVDLIAVDLPGFGGSEGGMELMNFPAQSAFLEKIINALGLNHFHIVAPDIAMPVAMHYVMFREHSVKSIIIGDGPGILPSDDGSLIRKISGSAVWRAIVALMERVLSSPQQLRLVSSLQPNRCRAQ